MFSLTLNTGDAEWTADQLFTATPDRRLVWGIEADEGTCAPIWEEHENGAGYRFLAYQLWFLLESDEDLGDFEGIDLQRGVLYTTEEDALSSVQVPDFSAAFNYVYEPN